ncbi:hypothetical protein QYF61_010850 [Mycteria americana]|uniref:Uncharacterized protein n=1 Tax=Mycteria americana TaxID=33587 RepID=A0AAN7MY50_MYCAM|nr:hypothetical protein QYF61_010850 [Mycteria americana]
MQPTEEKAQEGLICMYKYLMGGMKIREPDSCQWYPLTGKEAMDTQTEIQEKLSKHEKTLFYCCVAVVVDAAATRDGVRKVKADLELLQGAGDVKENKKGFHKHINSKRKTRENMGPLLNGAGELVTKTRKRPSKNWLQESQAPETTGKVWNKEDLAFIEEDQIGEH